MIKNSPHWPNGARCAVAFSFDVDADSVVHTTCAARALDQVHAIAQMRYDPAVALPRIIGLFAGYNIPLTCFVPGWVIETYPDVVTTILSHPNEVAHHGYYHGWPNKESRGQERRTLEEGIRAIERLTGKRPVGYRAPYYALSRHTFDLLIEAEFAYDSSLFADDVPILLDNGRGTLIELSVPATIDDYNQYVSSRTLDHVMKISAPRQALEVFQAEFDALWEFGGLWVSVWHPAVSGRPAQALAIRSLIEHMLGKGNVWFASLGEVTTYIRQLMVDGHWSPRIERVPFYKKPVFRRAGKLRQR